MTGLEEFTGPRAAEAVDGLMVTLRAAIRAGGRGQVPTVVTELAEALHAAAVAHERRGSGAGTSDGAPGTMDHVTRAWSTPGEAARRVGCSAEYVRRLARTGRVPARRVGPVWEVDRDALDELYRREAS
ncbi:helix-turn-helix domain-containing protein [Cellulomonas sp. ATA003]|uniref:helix-turn-helix domain-containing protein n=1 Tax=Cellulomonas sp. ATA003 TaxID=3073064 RepID=UPI002873EB72|nr:helix-turn-helix domain-containing protein [Cellulomonas sp. ATA003]WNB84530.1 helix-turn-helix domain-containing protein [Cellulomonas sp. ATA003]